MRLPAFWLARHRVHVALPAMLVLMLVAQPVAAANNPQGDVNNAQQNLNNAQQNAKNAQNHASSEDLMLAAAQARLAAITAQLRALEQRVSALDATVATDSAVVARLDTELASDRAHLAAYVRQAYENGGSIALLIYIISAKDIPTAIQRKEQEDHVASAAQQLVQRINTETALAQKTLDADNAARAQLAVAQQQERTTQALVAVQEEQVSSADLAAHQAVSQAQSQLTAAQKKLVAEEAALAAARAADIIYSPVPGSQFTVDTNLTLPSGETSDRINTFLQGTSMAGLGGSFMTAEHAYHVSARYFVAHAILESDWGSSAIAQGKHNLFGFGADDANPYKDARSFPNFDACIQYVAQFIEVNYLTPGGRYFHGSTLRGMNVDYASDPNWAEKIASIAQTIP